MSRDAGPSLQLIPFEIGGLRGAFDLSAVMRIDRIDQLEIRSQADHAGAIGCLADASKTPVYSLSARLGSKNRTPGPSNRILVLEGAQGTVGWLVDRVLRAVEIAVERVQPLPWLLGSYAAKHYQGVAVSEQDEALLVVSPSMLRTRPNPPTEELPFSDPSAGLGPATAGRGASEISTEHSFYPSATALLPHREGSSQKARANAGNAAAHRMLLFSTAFTRASPARRAVGLSARQVLEVLEHPPIVPIASAPGFIAGITVWRGKPLAVLHLDRYLGWSAEALRAEPRMIVTRFGSGEPVGLSAGVDVRGQALPVAHKAVVDPSGAPPERIHGSFAVGATTIIIPNLSDLANAVSAGPF